MKTHMLWKWAGVLALMGSTQAFAADRELPFQTAEEEAKLSEQTRELFHTLDPIVGEASKSTVQVYLGRRPVALGTVIDGNRVLSKWSEIARRGVLTVQSNGNRMAASVVGVYPEEDVAVLSVPEIKAPVVTWTYGEAPKRGMMLTAAGPDGYSLDLGVVSVNERSLREVDQGFLGIGGESNPTEKGVLVNQIAEGSPAAAVGLRLGDIILQLDEKEVNGPLELRTALQGRMPKEIVNLKYMRDGKEDEIRVTLGQRPKAFEATPQRLQVMERMGTSLSNVRSGFSYVVQTDLPLESNECGGPVVDLKGHVIGMSIARADRTRSFFITSDRVKEMLSRPALKPEEAVAKAQEEQKSEMLAAREAEPQQMKAPMPKADRRSVERMRRNLRDMQLLMERFEEEMRALEQR